MFSPFDSVEQVSSTVASLKKSRYPLSIMLLLSKDRNDPDIEGCRSLFVDDLYSTETIRQVAENIPEDGYTILCSGYSPVCFGSCAIDRFIRIAEDTGSGLCYADYYKNIAGKEEKHPVIDYLSGSIRDDFDFGTILFYRNRSIREAAGQMKEIYRYAGWYDLRLRVSRKSLPVHILSFYILKANMISVNPEKSSLTMSIRATVPYR